jgi:hypothetical protein
VRRPRRIGLRGVDRGADRRLAREQTLLVEQRGERDPGKARAAPPEKRPAVEEVPAGMGEGVSHQYTVMNSLEL